MKMLPLDFKDLKERRKLTIKEAEMLISDEHDILCFIEPRSVYKIVDQSDFYQVVNLMQQKIYKAEFYEDPEIVSIVVDLKPVNVEAGEFEKYSELQVSELKEYLDSGIPVICKTAPNKFYLLEEYQDLRKVIPYDTAENKIRFFIN